MKHLVRIFVSVECPHQNLWGKFNLYFNIIETNVKLEFISS